MQLIAVSSSALTVTPWCDMEMLKAFLHNEKGRGSERKTENKTGQLFYSPPLKERYTCTVKKKECFVHILYYTILYTFG